MERKTEDPIKEFANALYDHMTSDEMLSSMGVTREILEVSAAPLPMSDENEIGRRIKL